jgi:hypothetical protein
MDENPYFYWVLFTDIFIIAAVIIYVVRDRLSKDTKDNKKS